ncbi:hypothetical protein GCM10027275_34670 [Rhabdobacter roseus]
MLVATAVAATLSVSTLAQSKKQQKRYLAAQEVPQGDATKENAPAFFPAYASVTMADGTSKPISKVCAGERIKCYYEGQLTTTHVKEVATAALTSITELYLRPVDEVTASRQSWPMVPALLLEATPNHPVQTLAGRKLVSELKKGDVLLRYEAATGLLSAWKVGLIQAKARPVATACTLRTEMGSFLVENLVVLDR